MTAFLPSSQLVIVLIFRSEHLHFDNLSKGWWGVCSSAGFPGNWWANLMSILLITGSLPLPPWWRVPVQWGCCSRTLLQTSKLLHPLNYQCLCGSIFSLEAGQAQGFLQVFGVQPNTHPALHHILNINPICYFNASKLLLFFCLSPGVDYEMNFSLCVFPPA